MVSAPQSAAPKATEAFRSKIHRPPWFQEQGESGRPKPFTPPKPSRRTPGDQTRLHINVGAEMGVGPGDVAGAIMGETGLPSKTVGLIDVRERHLFVDVAAEHAPAIIAKLNRTRIKGNKLKVKLT
jgi:ATP-dependent RNA helicase DeaD